MIHRVFASLLVAALMSPAAAEDSDVTVFQNVRVLTMTDAGVLEDATVTVEGDSILSIGVLRIQRADVPQPPGDLHGGDRLTHLA